MGRVKRLLPVLALVLFISGCGNKRADITIMDPFLTSDSNSTILNNLYDEFSLRIDEWEKVHPEITVTERKQYHEAELGSLGRLGVDHLPDMFVLSSIAGRIFQGSERVLDLSEYIDVENADPFTYGGEIYAFPVMNPSYTLVVYDPDAWDSGEDVAVGCNKAQLLSCIAADKNDWFRHMVDGDKEASFVDEDIVVKLDKAREMSSNTATVEDFVSGDGKAILLGGDYVYKLLEKLKNQNTDLYERIEFTSLDGEHIPCGYSRGLFLNPKLAEDSRKLAQCLDFCQSLTAEGNGADSEVLHKLTACVSKYEQTPSWDMYLSGDVWSQLTFESDKNAGQIASILQNKYEEYYLNTVDFSKELDRYSSGGMLIGGSI